MAQGARLLVIREFFLTAAAPTFLIAACRRRGLVGVYLGIESGSPAGLRTLNKRATVEQNLEAIAILKKLDMDFDVGIMLFDPDSTVDSVQENIDFLHAVTGDGCRPANFWKMLPYAGTPIEDRLARQGRLGGTTAWPDYALLDERLDWYAVFAARTFRFRNLDSLGLVERLRLACFDQLLVKRFQLNAAGNTYAQDLTQVIARANQLVLDTLQRALDFVKVRDGYGIAREASALNALAREQWEADERLQQELDAILERHNPGLLQAYSTEFRRRTALGELDRAPVLPTRDGA